MGLLARAPRDILNLPRPKEGGAYASEPYRRDLEKLRDMGVGKDGRKNEERGQNEEDEEDEDAVAAEAAVAQTVVRFLAAAARAEDEGVYVPLRQLVCLVKVPGHTVFMDAESPLGEERVLFVWDEAGDGDGNADRDEDDVGRLREVRVADLERE